LAQLYRAQERGAKAESGHHVVVMAEGTDDFSFLRTMMTNTMDLMGHDAYLASMREAEL
jgi:hypothetical protein